MPLGHASGIYRPSHQHSIPNTEWGAFLGERHRATVLKRQRAATATRNPREGDDGSQGKQRQTITNSHSNGREHSAPVKWSGGTLIQAHRCRHLRRGVRVASQALVSIDSEPCRSLHRWSVRELSPSADKSRLL